jgi:hypothetical protein
MFDAVYRNYQTYIRRLNRTGTWMPGDVVKLGEVGKLRRGCFDRQTSLSELGIDARLEAGEPSEVATFSSGRQLSPRLTADAGFGATAEGSVVLEFAKRGQFLLSCRGLEHQRIENIGHVNKQIIRYHELGKWDPQWVLIDQIWRADFFMVVLSRSRKAQVSLTAKAASIPSFDAISDPSLDVGVSVQSGDTWDARGSNVVPFFSGRRLKRRLFCDNETHQISTRPEDEETIELVPLDFMDDLIGSWRADESTST